jgi:phosphoribosylaminoimidazole-succinocarboxamide synthase
LPVVPEDVRIKTAETYLDAYREITAGTFPLTVGDAAERIRGNLTTHGYL